jgi:threonine dehydratase
VTRPSAEAVGHAGPVPELGRTQISAAAVHLAGLVRRTPVLAVHGAELGTAATVLLKLELTQHTGSFKARGALNALLAADVPAGGVVAASGGNHGAAVAWAAARLGVPATVFVPATSPPLKAERIRGYGATVRVVDGYYADAAVAAAGFAAEHGLPAVHAYDDPAVVAGQGTVGLELLDQADGVDEVLVTVGGGGLAAGITVACEGRARVVPVEPAACPTLAGALAAGAPVDVDVGGVAADSCGARVLGTIAYRVLDSAAAGVVPVDDDAIVAAQRWLWEAVRVVAEPGGAVALAALLSGAHQPRPGSTVVVVVSGGNTAALPVRDA